MNKLTSEWMYGWIRRTQITGFNTLSARQDTSRRDVTKDDFESEESIDTWSGKMSFKTR